MEVSWTVRATDSRPHIDLPPFHEWLLPDGTCWALFFRKERDYLIRFPSIADYCVIGDGSRVICWPALGVSDATIRHLYCNQVLPLALSIQGELIFHASAVELCGGAVAFMGNSGTGKSTLAASFALAGCRFLTDDGLRTTQSEGRFEVQPGHPSIRLWPDSQEAVVVHDPQLVPAPQYSSKARLLADETIAFCPEPRPLRRVYVLGDDIAKGVVFSRLNAREAMLALVKHSFLLNIDEQEMLGYHFECLCQIVSTSTIYRIDYSRCYESLPKVRTAVIHNVAA